MMSFVRSLGYPLKSASLLAKIQSAFDQQVTHHVKKLKNRYLKKPLILSRETTGRVFLPALIGAASFHQGVLTIPASSGFNEQMISTALCCFPLKSTEQKAPVCHDLNCEPITLEAVTLAMQGTSIKDVLSALAPPAISRSPPEQGLKIEKMLAFHLALETQRRRCYGGSELAVGDLLSTFKPKAAPSISVLDGFTTRAKRANE